MKKVLIILGHPDNNTLNGNLANFCYEEIGKMGLDVKILKLGDLKFDVNLKKGYREIQPLEPDLVAAQQLIIWADELIFFFPTWWYNLPVILKGFLERVFLPGFAFKYRDKGLPDKFLVGKSAMIFTTAGGPTMFYRLVGHPGIKSLVMSLKFCGVKIRATRVFGGINKTTKDVELKRCIKKKLELLK